MVNLAILRAEMDLPAYSGMTDEQILTALTTANIEVPIDTLTSAEIYECIDTAEYNAASTANKSKVDRILGLGGDIKCSAPSKARTELLAVFAVNSATRAALAAATKRMITRAEQLGISNVTLIDIRDARTL